MAESFAERLRRLREEQGFTVATLALEVGVSEGAIRQLETGNVKSPSFVVGLRLAHRLGVDPYELALGKGSTLEERLTVAERRIAKLEQRVTSNTTRR
ncbi:MAG TPA: helix-turn-helix transcriptional regulator [Candidatus Elarobacter sp.]|jgi:transcriptional regulator with XRE-family HTH domain